MTHSSLRAGLKHQFSFRITEDKTVPCLYPESQEFSIMPKVLATGYMVGLFEWACVQAVNPYIDWPREQTVGTGVCLTHEAATPPGLVVTVRVSLESVEGRKLTFSIVADDGVDVISRGSHERFIIVASRFDEKAKAKSLQSSFLPGLQ